MKRIPLVATVLAGFVISALPVAAQPIATFRWQLQPYCNVVSLAITQSGGVFRLDGADNQCGAATHAAVAGVAFFNPNGTVGLGFTIVGSPGGAPVHVDATLTLPALTGTWRDSSGHSGTFSPTQGTGTGGAARPLGGGAIHEAIFSAFDALANGTFSIDVGGCRTFATSGGSNLLLGLSLPRGAVIVEVSLKISDTSNNAAASAVLVRDDYPVGGPPGLTVASEVLPPPDNAHSHSPLVLIPAAIVPVSPARSYHVDVFAPTHTGTIAFCGATVRYTIDPTAAALDSGGVQPQ